MHTSGCGQAPAVVTVGKGTFDLAVSVKTDTVYAPATGAAFNGHTVAVINGATCNATNHSGCGHLAATVHVGLAPLGVAVNDQTHTVYVTNNTLGDTPGTVSVINAAACNGSHTLGCAGRMPTAPAGRSPGVIVVDTRTDIIYTADEFSAAVTVLNGAQVPGRDDTRLPPRGDHASGRLHPHRRRRQPADQNHLRHGPLPGRLHVNLPQPPVMRSCGDLR